MKTYPYAVIRSAGCTGQGSVAVTSVHMTADAAKQRAARLTRQHQALMARHGGTSGGYVAVEWGRTRNQHFWDDMRPKAI